MSNHGKPPLDPGGAAGVSLGSEPKVPDQDPELSRSVLDALPAPVAVLGHDGCIIQVNHAWRRLAAESNEPPEPEGGLGLAFIAACRAVLGRDAEQARAIADGVTSVLEGRAEGFSTEYPCHAAHRERWFSITVRPLGEGPSGAVVIHYDISARKRAEDQTRRARECAAQAARVSAVGVLAASLVHELTQPLSAASFYSATAVALLGRGEMAPERLRPALAGVDAQIQRATEIVHRLRGFLRQREMRLEPVSLDEVIAGASELVQWFATERRVGLHYGGAEPGLVVRADAIQLEQVLVNLMCNSIQAIDAAAMDRREVSVGVARVAQEVEVTVRDTGPGLGPEHHARLFDIFASTKDVGLGLGLSISREIVEAHGGRLWSDAGVLDGACFRFTVPLQVPDLSAAERGRGA